MLYINDMKEKIDNQIKDSFQFYPGSLDTFTGQDLRHLLEIQFEKEKSYKEGFEQGVEEAGKRSISDLRKWLVLYMTINTRIVDYVKETIEKKFKPVDFEFIEARADLSFFLTKEIKILFVVDTDTDKELEMISLLSDISINVFEEENIFPELLVLNKRDKEIDKVAINCTYPAIRVFKKDA